MDPLECASCGGSLRIIALIGDVGVIERIHEHLKTWDPQRDTLAPAGPGPPLPRGETIPLSCLTVADSAWTVFRGAYGARWNSL